MPFDATVGGPDATSYTDVASADAYFEARLNTAAWDALDSTGKQKALMAATTRLEQETYVGWKPTIDQRLKWPRVDTYDDDGRLYPTDAIPAPLIGATCEMALALLNSGATDLLAPTGLEGFQEITIGDLDITPNPDARRPGALPDAVLRWLRGLLVTSSGMSKLVRG